MSLQNLTGDPLVVASVRETYCRVVTDPTAVDMLVTDSTVAFNIAASITSKLLPSSILDAQPGSVRLRLRDDSGAASANPITLVGNGALIDGQPSVQIDTNFGALELEWTGGRWRIVSRNSAASTVIPPGLGWIKQGPADVFNSLPTVPATEVDYVVADPSDWSTSPARVNAGLDILANRISHPLDGIRVIDEDFQNIGSTGSILAAGSTNWTFSASGTGASVAAGTASETSVDAKGVVALASGTATPWRAGIMQGPLLKLSDGVSMSRFTCIWTWSFQSLFSATDPGTYYAGLNNSISLTGPGVWGLYFRYDGNGVSNTLTAVRRVAGVDVTMAAGTVSANTVYRTRIDSDGINVVFRIATGRTATAWTTVWTIPVATILAEAWGANLIGPAAKIQKTAGTTSVRALVDRFQWSDPNS